MINELKVKSNLLKGDMFEGINHRTIDGGCLIYADDTGSSDLLVYIDKTYVGVFDQWTKLENSLKEKKLLKVSKTGCQFLLGNGFVPPPFTLYKNVLRLTYGDRLKVNFNNDKVKYFVEFPYFSSNSKNNSDFSTSYLKSCLSESVSSLSNMDKPIYFMQSSGKDSIGLLIALNEANVKNVHSITYNPKYKEEEAEDAKNIANKFGYNHTVVNSNPVKEYEALEKFCEKSPIINADYAFIPYIFSLQSVNAVDSVIIDGMGNDIYMGHIPPKIETYLKKVSVAKFLPVLPKIFEVPPVGDKGTYLLKSMLMQPTERVNSGSHVAHSKVLSLFPQKTYYDSFFETLYKKYKHLNEVDLRAYVRGRLFDNASCMEKGRIAAESMSSKTIFPFTDEKLIDYYFNLRQDLRYNIEERVNKVSLRKMINKEMSNGLRYLNEKGSFRFNVMKFIDINKEKIFNEIKNADNIVPGIYKVFTFYWKRKNNYVFNGALHHLIVLSLWLNRRETETIFDLQQDYPDFEIDIEFNF
ncbi:asparagine synthase-related protein [Halalkalibacter urbisdiaboli]|uniref:asparagine synthase-related protein n=1 Tax=Halalkalibacter urbisdiaboli TaxID=1960589 RepID=UPI000B433C4D|nr:asparagine synthase-related protein [Halalkalibacter urbisdiaboli]